MKMNGKEIKSVNRVASVKIYEDRRVRGGDEKSTSTFHKGIYIYAATDHFLTWTFVCRGEGKEGKKREEGRERD